MTTLTDLYKETDELITALIDNLEKSYHGCENLDKADWINDCISCRAIKLIKKLKKFSKEFL